MACPGTSLLSNVDEKKNYLEDAHNTNVVVPRDKPKDAVMSTGDFHQAAPLPSCTNNSIPTALKQAPGWKSHALAQASCF